MNNPFKPPIGRAMDLSKKLVEKENDEAMKEMQAKLKIWEKKMKDAEMAIIEVCAKYEINWQEWGQIVENFNRHNIAHFNKIQISTINNYTYVQPTDRTGEEINGSGKGSPSQG